MLFIILPMKRIAECTIVCSLQSIMMLKALITLQEVTDVPFLSIKLCILNVKQVVSC